MLNLRIYGLLCAAFAGGNRMTTQGSGFNFNYLLYSPLAAQAVIFSGVGRGGLAGQNYKIFPTRSARVYNSSRS
jgi:hypothetical protein